MRLKTLIIDNYDSFTFNLFQYLGELGANPLVYRNDKISLSEARTINPTHIVLSPGPGRPDDPAYFGVCLDLIRKAGQQIPLLGVCLGHQGIIYAFGGRVVKAPKIMHGKTSLVTHDQEGLFRGVKSPAAVMRYHSLIGSRTSWPKCLRVTAKTKEGVVMAVEHEEYPIFGIQFHPESIGTPDGKKILSNFLTLN